MAAYLKRAGIRIDAVYNSGKTRARQTAEILGAVLVPEKEPEVKKGLGPLDDVKLMFDEIRLLEKDIIIVGHLPHLEKLTSLLVTGGDSHSVVRFQQGGVVCITSDEETEKWHIAWMQIPGMVA